MNQLKKSSATVSIFWEAFFHYLHDTNLSGLFYTPTEKLRFQCLVGFTALDASMNFYWQGEIIPDWPETLCLIYATLEDEESISLLCKEAQPYLSKSQIVASLRFLSHTGEAEKFSPTFVDVGLLLLMRSPTKLDDPNFLELTRNLFKMQKTRNACFHTGRSFEELAGFESLKLLENFESEGQLLSPCFSTHPLKGLQPENQKQAA